MNIFTGAQGFRGAEDLVRDAGVKREWDVFEVSLWIIRECGLGNEMHARYETQIDRHVLRFCDYLVFRFLTFAAGLGNPMCRPNYTFQIREWAPHPDRWSPFIHPMR